LLSIFCSYKFNKLLFNSFFSIIFLSIYLPVFFIFYIYLFFLCNYIALGKFMQLYLLLQFFNDELFIFIQNLNLTEIINIINYQYIFIIPFYIFIF
jgi:hypothetical protein